MIPSRSAARGAVAAVLAVAALAGCGSMASMTSRTMSLTARLSGASEVPPVTTTGAGTLTASFDRDTSTLSWTVTYSGLTGAPTAGHFHGPAAPGANAGVVVPFTGSLATPIQGSAKLSDAQAADLVGGRWYVNIHTQAHPGGEIRGQVTQN